MGRRDAEGVHYSSYYFLCLKKKVESPAESERDRILIWGFKRKIKI